MITTRPTPTPITAEQIIRNPGAELREQVATLLFDEMQGRLLWPLLPRNRDSAVRLLVGAVCWDDVYAAVDQQTSVIATAFATGQDRPLCMARSVFRSEWGMAGALWRIGLIDLMRIGQRRSGSLRIEAVAVRSDHRGRGMGSRLMERVIADARTAGYAELALDVCDDNDTARHLAESLGFTVTRTLWAPPLENRHLRTFSSMSLNL